MAPYYYVKNLILTLLFFYSAGTFCSAQSEPNTFQIGVVAGPSHVFIRDDRKGNDIKSDFRGAAGISLRYNFGLLFLKSDLLYENKGYSFEPNGLVINDPAVVSSPIYHFHFHYLTLPVLLGVDIPETGFFLNAGSYGGLLLNETATSDAGNSDGASNKHKHDFGLSGGVGYSKALAPKLDVSAEVRHNYGLNNIHPSDYLHKNNSTSLLLGVHYTIGN
ncbi:porin family protein [Rufibacter roseus]|uniref:Porin family protein n=1 Tax=Rufibacter roseus TaxID=1567108 RepID=A0ABW2DH63_9BACT|nr:porin family protein [Rufibacter roseus]